MLRPKYGTSSLIAAILFFALPESPKFLARYPTRWPELENLLLRMRRAILPGTQFTHVAEQQMTSNVRLSALINHEFRRDTFALWVAFLTCLFTIYMVFSWLPAMLVAAGFTPAQASLGLEIYNAGGVAGALACALVIARYGSRWPLIACCAGGSALALIAVDHVVASSFPKLIAAITIHGFFANAVQSILFALSAFVYPTPIRARGSAFAVAFGRCGAILAGSVGAFVISSNSARYFLLLASALFITMIALGVQRRHIPAQSSSR